MVNSTTNTHTILRRNEQNVKKFVTFHSFGLLEGPSLHAGLSCGRLQSRKKRLTKAFSGDKVEVKQTISLTETPVFQKFPCQRAPGAG